MPNIELLAPAGDLEKLKIACIYGADAVYFGGESFSLRAGAGNLTVPEMEEGIAFAHARGVRCYLTVNIYPHNQDIEPLRAYLASLAGLDLDGVLVSDPGALTLVREYLPDAELHLSTQANMTNYLTADFWYRQGVRRIVTARELSIAEIRGLRANIPEDMHLEAFVHGAMCISYSGRCLLSNYMVGRDANKGECAHPCRWQYALMEAKRPGEYWPIEEDGRGTYILNSRDLCMIDHLEDLLDAGVTAFKIEGRMKSIYYLAVVTDAYRRALDNALIGRPVDPSLKDKVAEVSHRAFSTGFYYGKPSEEGQNYETSEYLRDYEFLGIVKEYDETTGIATVEQRNKFSRGDTVEILGPGEEPIVQIVDDLTDEEGTPLESAPHAQQLLKIRMDRPVGPAYLLRKKKGMKQ